MLCVNNLSLGYSGHIIIEELSFELASGGLIFVTGANGSGKSTLLRGILGLTKILLGEIKINKGIKIAYVPQAEAERTEYNFPASIREIVLMGRQRPFKLFYNSRDVQAASYAMTRFEINNLDAQLGQLSGGQMRRVLLARAFCAEPDLLLLDEPCAGLDASGREIFYDYLNDLRLKYNTAVLMVTHDDKLNLKPDKIINL